MYKEKIEQYLFGHAHNEIHDVIQREQELLLNKCQLLHCAYFTEDTQLCEALIQSIQREFDKIPNNKESKRIASIEYHNDGSLVFPLPLKNNLHCRSYSTIYIDPWVVDEEMYAKVQTQDLKKFANSLWSHIIRHTDIGPFISSALKYYPPSSHTSYADIKQKVLMHENSDRAIQKEMYDMGFYPYAARKILHEVTIYIQTLEQLPADFLVEKYVMPTILSMQPVVQEYYSKNKHYTPYTYFSNIFQSRLLQDFPDVYANFFGSSENFISFTEEQSVEQIEWLDNHIEKLKSNPDIKKALKRKCII